MIIPEWLKDELEGKKYTPKGPASIIDKGIKTTWEIPGLLVDMIKSKGRSEGLAVPLPPRTSSKRKEDAAIRETGALGIGGTKQTRPHNYLTNPDKIDKVITTPTTITEEQMQLKSQEGVSNTLKIMEGDPRGDALREAVKNDPSLALQKEGKPNLGWSTVFDTVDADGQPQVLTRNQRKAWEMKNQDLAPKPEPPSAVNPSGNPVDKPLPGTGSRYNQDGSKRQLGVIEELPTPNQEASKQTNTQAFDGTAEGTQAGLSNIAAIAGGLNKLLNKPKEKGVMIPGLHESKDVQLVAAANPWDEFANLMG